MSDQASRETRASTYAYLRRHVDEYGEVEVSLREIGVGIDRGMNTVSRAVKYWIRGGHVVVLRRGTGGSYRTRYRVVGVGRPRKHDNDLLSLAS